MARTKSVKKTKTARHNATTAKFKPSAPRLKGLPKRVQHGGRIIMSHADWEQCVEVYIATNCYPTSEEKQALADSLGRCPKQMSIWFGNRRQDFAKAKKNGEIFPTEASKRKFLWSKWRAQEQDGSEVIFDSGLTDATSELTRASSTETSEYSVYEATTPAPENDTEPAITDPLLMLLEAAKLIDAEEATRDVCATLVGLKCV